MPWTYILECRDGSFYTGSTNGDLEARVWEHNHDDAFAADFTRRRRPAALVYAECFDTVDAAFFREKQIQGWSRRKKIALIESRWEDLPSLSRSYGALRQAQRPSAADRFDKLSDPTATDRFDKLSDPAPTDAL
ncbi:GIY-YIG nuclease family protein [Microbacterium sp. p3-SID338]|uniref:GIY-YIG nuclease family protein n=1 Tax=unclassified Microbacterium TaxID=2609290 RepID=UPI000C80495A|nr:MULTISPECIES: GIY-YIG nuclease family protein [unclassified Microbacterium]MCT1396228.1 GIY-YIG nuclease family protein [Microbacterium sp. p3-SID338]PMC02346.1 hypothetical protein CJ226_15420 [Microbacterium sp. UMB0228]